MVRDYIYHEKSCLKVPCSSLMNMILQYPCSCLSANMLVVRSVFVVLGAVFGLNIFYS